MKNYYALQRSMYSYNDSDELIREWGTATVLKFRSKAARDSAVDADPYTFKLTYNRARYIGIPECYAD